MRRRGIEIQGVFKPFYRSLTAGDQGQTHDIQLGTYTRIEDRVFFELHVRMLTQGAVLDADVVCVSGFPYPMVDEVGTATIGQGVSLNLPSTRPLIARFMVDSSFLRIALMTNTDENDLTFGQLSLGGELKISGQYRTN